ncbi:MAG: glycine/sarcosine/betaine reductase selenoprotein B family protein [Deltaproteobacteria bacterium]|nr:glycine/sarcosine/betaine reductase selenoprotein B family protein [Deltaproteobacteria bacterium]
MGIWHKLDKLLARTAGRYGDLMRLLVKVIPSAKPDGSDPFTVLSKPISECKIALLTTCGVHLPTQMPFDMDARSGDPSYRAFTWQDIRKAYVISHSHINADSIMKDINVAVPGDRIEELITQGVVAALHPTVYSFMGYIVNTKPLVRTYAPEVAKKLKQDGVDIAVITPC